MKLKILAILIVTIGLSVIFWSGRSSASTGVIYISPASSSVQVNQYVTVALRINPGTSVNAVQATVNYNPSDLQYVSTTLSAFPVCAQNVGGGGVVTLGCAQLSTSTSSDSLIANISFLALSGSGSTALTISGAEAANAGVNTNPSTANGSVSFSSPAPSPSPTHSSTNTGSVYKGAAGGVIAPSPVTTTTAPVSTPAPPQKVIISSHILNLQFNTANVSISTNIAVQTFIKYGIDKNNLDLSTTQSNPTLSSTSVLGPSLIPGTVYYYMVEAKDTNGNITDGQIQQFTTKGYTISITVLDSDYQPIVNKLVTLHTNPITATTNAQGVATFTNVPPGMHHIEYTNAGHTYINPVYVANNVTTASNSQQVAAKQAVAVILNGYKQARSNNFWIYIVLVALIVGILYLLFRLIPMLKIDSKNRHIFPAIIQGINKSKTS